jgi:hypothetical protein
MQESISSRADFDSTLSSLPHRSPDLTRITRSTSTACYVARPISLMFGSHVTANNITTTKTVKRMHLNKHHSLRISES